MDPSAARLSRRGRGAAVCTRHLAIYQRHGASRQVAIVGIGLCLGLLPLMRRHFAYDCLGFVAAIVLHTLWTTTTQLRGGARQALSDCLLKGLRIAAVGGIAVAFLLTVGGRYVRHVLATPYATLYADYTGPPASVALWFCHQYGWGTLVLAFLGFAAAMTIFRDSRPTITFVAILGSLCMMTWIFFARCNGPHFTLHFSWFVFSGVVLAFWVHGDRLAGDGDYRSSLLPPQQCS